DARIATVRNEIDAMRAAFRQSEAELGEATATVRYFEREAGRQRRLAKSGAGTAARLDEAEFELASARQRVLGLREKIRKVLAELGGDPERSAELHPNFL